MRGKEAGVETQWAVGLERPHAYVESALRTLAREGLLISQVGLVGPPHAWAVAIADRISTNDCKAAVVFCSSPGLAACVANKVRGVRAVPVSTINQAGLAIMEVGANLLAVESQGRTFFEVRQMMRLLFASRIQCPPAVLQAIEEAESRANR